MSFERVGAAMGRDPEQLIDWMSNGMKPCKRNMRFIERFLKKPEIIDIDYLQAL
jgi:hypothetical protein